MIINMFCRNSFSLFFPHHFFHSFPLLLPLSPHFVLLFPSLIHFFPLTSAFPFPSLLPFVTLASFLLCPSLLHSFSLTSSFPTPDVFFSFPSLLHSITSLLHSLTSLLHSLTSLLHSIPLTSSFRNTHFLSSLPLTYSFLFPCCLFRKDKTYGKHFVWIVQPQQLNTSWIYFCTG